VKFIASVALFIVRNKCVGRWRLLLRLLVGCVKCTMKKAKREEFGESFLSLCSECLDSNDRSGFIRWRGWRSEWKWRLSDNDAHVKISIYG
jgi:hypothetical protein